MIQILPLDVLKLIFIDYLNLTSPPAVHLSLVNKDWYSFLTSKDYLSCCTLYLQQIDVVRLQQWHRHQKRLALLNDANDYSSLQLRHFSPSASSQLECKDRLTHKEALIHYLTTRFTGMLHFDTQLIKSNLESSRSSTALQCISDILEALKENSSPIQGIIWHDNSLAAPARRIGIAFRRNVELWGWSEGEVSTMPFCSLHSNEFYSTRNRNNHKSDDDDVNTEDNGGVSITLHPTKRIKHFNSTDDIILPEGSPTPPNHPIIFPIQSDNLTRHSNISKKCSCSLLSLFESLHICWNSLLRFLKQINQLQVFSLKGILFSYVYKAYNCGSYYSNNDHFSTQCSGSIASLHQLRQLDCCSDTFFGNELKVLEVVFPFLTCYNFHALQHLSILDTSGAIDLFHALLRTLSVISAQLRVLSIQINPIGSNIPIERESIVSQLINPYLNSTSKYSCFKSQESVVTPLVFQNLKELRLIWAANFLTLTQFLDHFEAPNLVSFHFEHVHVERFQMDRTIGCNVLSSLARFIQRSGGESGSLRYLYIDAKEFDNILQIVNLSQSQSHVFNPFLSSFFSLSFLPSKTAIGKISLHGLESLASSATFFNTLLAPQLSHSLRRWHCLRTSPLRSLHHDSAALQQSLLSLNERPKLETLILPAVPIHTEALQHIKRLTISNDGHTCYQPIHFTSICRRLEELTIIPFCNLNVLESCLASWGHTLTTLCFQGAVWGTAISFLHILQSCPNLNGIEVPDGLYLTEDVIRFLRDRHFSRLPASKPGGFGRRIAP